MNNPQANWFVGLPVSLPPVVLELVSNPPVKLKLFNPEDIHITLCFMGKLSPDKIDRVIETLSKISFSPIKVTLSKLRALPSPKYFSALSFETEQGNDQLTALISKWRVPLSKSAGVIMDKRPPLPHLTVARPFRKSPPSERNRILNWMTGITGPKEPFIVDRVALFTWADDRKVKQFKIIKECIQH